MKEIVYEQLGKIMMPDRWNRCMQLYKDAGMNATFKTYECAAHKFNRKNIHEDILGFIREYDK